MAFNATPIRALASIRLDTLPVDRQRKGDKTATTSIDNTSRLYSPLVLRTE